MSGKLFRIVVADDDLDDQELIHQAFKDSKANFSIVKVFDGVQLLDYLLKRWRFRQNTDLPPDLILLDLNMPLMDGFQVLTVLKETPSLSKIPVFVVTTSKSEADKQRAMASGATGFYHKGGSSKQIKDIVRQVCLECFS